MNSINRNILVGISMLLLVGTARPETESSLALEIVSFGRDGVLTWRSNRTNIYCGIQYTLTLPGYWDAAPSTNWWNVLMLTYTNSVTVPPSMFGLPSMFFRVVGSTNPLPNEIYDVVSNGIPEFVTVNYIELDKINRLSRFRSAAGHDYSDDFESCRSMKHYFAVDYAYTGSTVKVFSPVAGVITDMHAEQTGGTQVRIKSTDYPAFRFYLFHVNVTNSLHVGDSVAAGQQVGAHYGGPVGASDIAVRVVTPTGYKLVSYFDVMTDSLFQAYEQRGVFSRADLIITKEQRDADPLTCNGETFLTQGNLPNYVDLGPVPSPSVSTQTTSSSRFMQKGLKLTAPKKTGQRFR